MVLPTPRSRRLCRVPIAQLLLISAYRIAYCLLPTVVVLHSCDTCIAYCHTVFPTVYCLLPTADGGSLLTPTTPPLPAVDCLLPTAYCLLPVVYCVLPIVYYLAYAL